MRSRSFGPVVLLGLAGAAGTAVAGTKDWVHSDESVAMRQATGVALDAPGVTALGLVALAAWGVALVTRGWVRRGVLVLAGLAAVGAVPVALVGRPDGDPTAWPWIALAAAVVAAAAAVAGVRLARGWPEMGRRYDAPTSGPATEAPLEEQSSLDLWKSIGEGRDPTADGPE
ncbi:Trp biosynthesis-associated membrane protein [Nocardioides sp. KR10-350]|uniref:Trp biosynthesis-associated membrane protein n=1 Tax=Nocardioides cheoyonin TaxID=3156615 RepID=UPI0032B37404